MTEKEVAIKTISERYRRMAPHLNERQRRLFAASEAMGHGRGGVCWASEACGLTRKTIYAGIRDLQTQEAPPSGRIRHLGGGRKCMEAAQPAFSRKVEELVESGTRGDPMKVLRWTCKSTRRLSRELSEQGVRASERTVARHLKDAGFSLQGCRKAEEGNSHPDRDAQFQLIDGRVRARLSAGEPVISVDTKKKELVGNYTNPGRQWRRKGAAPRVNGHDFPSPEVPRAYPYGVYDIGRNTGHVNVGTSHDTPSFAAASIRGWWREEGAALYSHASSLTITADGGGSNASRSRLWKLELQRFAEETGLAVHVMHFPPGTSKWNKIEHRLFSFISSNWRGEALVDYETIVSLIAATTTAKGLKVSCRLDAGEYPKGITVSDKDFAAIRLEKEDFHGEWNYTIHPRSKHT